MELEKLNVDLQLMQLPVYHGIGTFETHGMVTFHASLPREARNQITDYQIFDLGETIFAQMITEPPVNSPYTNPLNDVVKLHFTIPGFKRDGRTKMTLFLWHNNDTVRNESDARQIMQQSCTAANALYTQPGKCGKGVLNFDI